MLSPKQTTVVTPWQIFKPFQTLSISMCITSFTEFLYRSVLAWSNTSLYNNNKKPNSDQTLKKGQDTEEEDKLQKLLGMNKLWPVTSHTNDSIKNLFKKKKVTEIDV